MRRRLHAGVPAATLEGDAFVAGEMAAHWNTPARRHGPRVSADTGNSVLRTGVRLMDTERERPLDPLQVLILRHLESSDFAQTVYEIASECSNAESPRRSTKTLVPCANV